MTINECKQIFDYVADSVQRGKISGTEFTQLFNMQQNSYYEFLLGKVEQFQYGRSVPRVGVGMSNNITTRLSPFIVKNDTVPVSAFKMQKPADFGRLVYMSGNSDNSYVELIDHMFKFNRKNSVIIGTPYCIEQDDYFEVYNTHVNVTLVYYKNRPDPVNWTFTVDSSYYEVFDDTDPDLADPLWLDMDCYKIIGRMLKVHGISIDDSSLIQYGQGVINTGE